MRVSAFVSQALCGLQATALSLAVIQMSVGPTLAAAAQAPNDLPSPGSLGNAAVTDQARHRDHRREPQLRPRVRHLPADGHQRSPAGSPEPAE